VFRLFRVPVVLVFAALFALGAYALGFQVLGGNFNAALIAACVGGVVMATVGLGSLTRVVWLVLLGIPITVGALATSVYVAGMHEVDTHQRYQVVVASEKCTHEYTHSTNHGRHTGCDRHAFTFNDTAGKPIEQQLEMPDIKNGHNVGDTLDVYQLKPGTIRIYPESFADPLPQVRTAATFLVPIFIGYAILCGIVGTVGAITRRRLGLMQYQQG
jgi:hypothetical protein